MNEIAPVLAPEVLPEYVASSVLDGAAREEAIRMMLRLAEHVRNKSTDQAEDIWAEPVENYYDEELFKAELDLIFKRIPLPLALSAELPGKNTYKAMDAAGVPVVITRDAKGEVHAMLNICRHRGALICGDGYGESRALTCPYHAWSYGMNGELRGIYGESTFGEFDKSERGLVQLPVVESAGLIFVCLTPGLEIDIDSWLGDFKPVLEALKLDECHVFSSRKMPGPNWKVVIEGYLEGYHFASLHPNTVFKTNLQQHGHLRRLRGARASRLRASHTRTRHRRGHRIARSVLARRLDHLAVPRHVVRGRLARADDVRVRAAGCDGGGVDDRAAGADPEAGHRGEP